MPPTTFRDRLDIVFAHRNKLYGAYALRRQYPTHLARALFYTLLLIAAALALPYILRAARAVVINPTDLLDVEITLGPPPDIAATTTPPPLPPELPAATPTRATRRFVPPRVTIDEQAPETSPSAIDELLRDDKDIDSADRAGDPDALPSLEPDIDAVLDAPSSSTPAGEVIYDPINVHKPPTFPGGEADLFRYLRENIHYPEAARTANIQGTVAIAFVIDQDGQVTHAEIIKEIGGGCGKEAMRVVKSMPRWSPGEANGHPVKVRYTLPVRFRLN